MKIILVFILIMATIKVVSMIGAWALIVILLLVPVIMSQVMRHF